MKKLFCLFFVILFSFQINASTIPLNDSSLNNYSTVIKPKSENPNADAIKVLAKMKISDIEKMLGRKLKFKEKIALKILKFKSRKNNSEETSSAEGIKAKKIGGLSLIFSIVFFPVGITLAILAIVKANKVLKKNPNDKAALQGKNRGFIALVLTTLFIVLAISTFLSEFKINLFGG